MTSVTFHNRPIQIRINGRVAPALSSRLRFLIEIRRIRALSGEEQIELARLFDLAQLAHNGEEQ